MHPCPTLTVLAAGQVAELPFSLSGSASVLGFTSLPRVFANASGRIEFIIFLIMDWSFASGCFPPRLSATQLPLATDSQCSVRRGLSPRCWCALSGARGTDLRAGPRGRELGDLPLPWVTNRADLFPVPCTSHRAAGTCERSHSPSPGERLAAVAVLQVFAAEESFPFLVKLNWVRKALRWISGYKSTSLSCWFAGSDCMSE